MTAGEQYRRMAARFERAGLPTPGDDARALLANRLGWSRTELPLRRNDPVSLQARVFLAADAFRRCRHEPVAFIVGYKDFYRDRFFVSRRTLIPRADTEHLLYAAEESGRQFRRILDVGTGSGALAVSLSRLYPASGIVALDVDIATARKNLRTFGIGNVELLRCDFLRESALANPSLTNAPFDLVISNPPYLSREDLRLLDRGAKFEHPRAFLGGEDGLAFYRAIASFCALGLTPDGLAIVETDHKFEAAAAVFRAAGFGTVEVRNDYNGLPRVIVAAR
jgi:release factor glutamine methyltransferase